MCTAGLKSKEWSRMLKRAMIFNFTHNYKFSTNLSHNGNEVEVINQTKLLGTIITDDLKWHKNTESLVKRANA